MIYLTLVIISFIASAIMFISSKKIKEELSGSYDDLEDFGFIILMVLLGVALSFTVFILPVSIIVFNSLNKNN